MTFRNSPELKDDNKDGMVKRYVHQPLDIDHFGIHAKIQPNGRIQISSVGTPIKGTDEVEYEMVEIPASLVFKLATLLKATRTIQFVSVAEAAKMPAIETE